MPPPGPVEPPDGFPHVRLRDAPAPFVNRREELSSLEGGLRDAIGGRPRVELISGDAGIGKSRLIREFGAAARAAGLDVCAGRCLEDVSIPYLPWVEALRARLDASPTEADGSVEDLRSFVQPGSERRPQRHWKVETDADQLDLFLSVSRSLITLARLRPTMLILEDLHWADPPSLELLAHVVFALSEASLSGPLPLVIVGSYRSAEPGEKLGRTVARIRREGVCRTLRVEGLDDTSTRDLIGGLGLERVSQELVHSVGRSTRGNPLFIREVLQHLVDRGSLVKKGGRLSTDADLSTLRLPEDVTHAIAARTREVSDECHQLLTLASFLGERFGMDQLRELTGSSDDEISIRIEEAIEHRLVATDDDGFVFDHPLVRHIFYREPIPHRRQRIHQQIAETLEKFYADRLDEHVLEIARHVVAAGTRADPAKLVEWARRAGDRASDLFAWSEAARYYVAAGSAASAQPDVSDAEIGELHYSAGVAYNHDWDVGPCLDQYDRAIEAYGRAGDARGLAYALKERVRAHFTLASVPFGELIDLEPLEAVLEELGEDEPVLRGMVLETMSEALWTARRPDEAQAMSRRALEIGTRLEDDLLRNQASFGLGLAQMQKLEVREALDSWADSLDYVQQGGDVWAENLPRQRIPMALHMLGRIDEAEGMAFQGFEHCRTTNNLGECSLALANLAGVALVRGDFEAAERHAQEAVAMVRRSRYPWSGPIALPALACSRALRGVWADAEDALGALVEPGRIFEEPGIPIQLMVAVLRDLLRAHARPGEADDSATLNLANAVKIAGVDANALGLVCALVEIADLRGLPELVEGPSETLSLALERGVVFSNGWVFLIPRVLGLAEALLGRWDEAGEHFEQAIRIATETRAKAELGRSCLDYARVLARRDGSHRELAVRLAQQAYVILGEMRMHPLAERAGALLAAFGLELAHEPPGSEGYPNDLRPHEVGILRRLARGQSRVEIEEDLLMSPETLDRHLITVCSKIGATDIETAAEFALEKGLAVRDSQGRASSRILMVTDIAESTRLMHRIGDVEAQRVIHDHNRMIRSCLRQNHGSETTHTGDGMIGSFRLASDAIACAVEIQQTFARYNDENPEAMIPVRIGLHAGDLLPEEDRVFGIAVNLAVRVCNQARPGEILASEVVRQLAAGSQYAFESRGPAKLKGFEEPVPIYQVDWRAGFTS